MKNTVLREVQITYDPKCKISDLVKVTSSKTVAEEIFKFSKKDQTSHIESFYIMLLNRANRVLGIQKIATGSTSACVVDPKIVFQYALKANASAIILSHNHPGGNLKASEEDKKITRKIKKGCEILDLTLLDHIIFTPDNEYLSMENEKLI